MSDNFHDQLFLKKKHISLNKKLCLLFYFDFNVKNVFKDFYQ